MSVFAISLILAAATPALGKPELIEGPITMKPSEIRAYNAKLSRDHPNYIRCVRTETIGSLIKRNVSCRTNAQWELSDRKGNDNARETYDAFRPRGNPGTDTN